MTRAKSANRSLQLLLGSVVALERRVRLYSQRYNDSNYKKQITSEVIKTYFEEIVEDSLSLEEKVINSIEDWKDILPDLEVKTVINLIRELNGNYDNTLAQLEQVNIALQETEDKSESDVNKLKKEKSEIEKELSRIQNQLREKSLQVGVPTISDSLITGSSSMFLTASPLTGSSVDVSSQLASQVTGFLQGEPAPITGKITLLETKESKEKKK